MIKFDYEKGKAGQIFQTTRMGVGGNNGLVVGGVQRLGALFRQDSLGVPVDWAERCG